MHVGVARRSTGLCKKIFPALTEMRAGTVHSRKNKKNETHVHVESGNDGAVQGGSNDSDMYRHFPDTPSDQSRRTTLVEWGIREQIVRDQKDEVSRAANRVAYENMFLVVIALFLAGCPSPASKRTEGGALAVCAVLVVAMFVMNLKRID